MDFSYTKSGLGKSIPINKSRAYEVLEELELDGLIALRPHNVFYLTNTYTTLTAFKEEYPAFGVFPRDPSQPSFLISSTGNTWETANGDREVPDVITFSAARNSQDYVNATAEQMKIEPESIGSSWSGFAFAPWEELSDRERRWFESQERYLPSSAPTPAWAIVRALKESGLANSRIAVDDMRIAYLLEAIGFDSVTLMDGDNVFRKIRQVKTAQEIEIMRAAQTMTQDSILAAIRHLEDGMTYEEVRHRFFAEAAARGGRGEFLLLGFTQGRLPDGVARRGRSYLLDCSVRFNMYQGDFARTVCIGEPTARAKKHFQAQQIGREAAFEIIKAGVSFRTVEKTARDAMIKAGMPASNVPIISLHSVGLQHGDDPSRFDIPFKAADNHVLEENMTVTLDLPYLEVGSVAGHNEDLLRVTKNGYEILNDPGEPMVVV